MAEFKFLDTTRAIASDIVADARTYISRIYGRALSAKLHLDGRLELI